MTLRTDSMINQIEGRYNPENDCIPGTPMVTHTDYTLLQIIEDLKLRIESLEAAAEERENGGYAKHVHGYSHD